MLPEASYSHLWGEIFPQLQKSLDLQIRFLEVEQVFIPNQYHLHHTSECSYYYGVPFVSIKSCKIFINDMIWTQTAPHTLLSLVIVAEFWLCETVL